MTLAILLLKIIFRFVRHPDQLTILQTPLTITRKKDKGDWMERTLAALKTSVALGGSSAELRRLAKRLSELGAGLDAELDAASSAFAAAGGTGQASHEV